MSDIDLLPIPRLLERTGEALRLATHASLALRGPVAGEPALERVLRALSAAGCEGSHSDDAQIRLQLDAELGLPDEGYRLAIDARGATLQASDARGLYWGAGVLEQLLSRGRTLPGLLIEDAPDFPVRGYMLDVSRDRVPTRESLERLVGTLAALRINQLQLYTEHTFAYRDHEAVWSAASPLTHDEIRWLDGLCRAQMIELVPNQNSFGHMERWLAHPAYRRLAERPEGGRRPPACLLPGEPSLRFLRSLYAELLPCFESRSINIGCDETFELGQGRSREACETRGRGRVYLEHLLGLIEGLHAEGRCVQFWGDIVEQHPELIAEVPTQGTIALVWGYEAPLDPSGLTPAAREQLERADIGATTLRGFEARVGAFARSGLPFWVCPGTSSWNSLIGRLPNALGNLRDAAEAGLAHGAGGFLITDWGDNGHLQPPPVSLPPLVYGAAVAWGLERNRDLPLDRLLSRLVFRDQSGALAAALRSLGETYTKIGTHAFNASPLALALLRPLEARQPTFGSTDAAHLEEVLGSLEGACAELERARPEHPEAELMHDELLQAARLARHGALRLMRSQLGAGPQDGALREDLEQAIEEQARVWLRRSRPGGLDDSLARLRARLDDYRGSHTE